MPAIKRPYRVPFEMLGLIMMCLIPSGFLIYVMVVANATVFIVSSLLTAIGILWYFVMKYCKSREWCRFSSKEGSEEEHHLVTHQVSDGFPLE